MAAQMKPSTEWQEQIPPDEATRFAAYGPIFAEIQKRKSARYGNGRALHRKQLCGAQGSLEVLGDLPEFARQGLFATPASYPTWVRLSNGGMDAASDRKPDIRGLALQVQGVQGDSALGNGPAQHQDFLFINQEQFAFARSAEFVAFVDAASRGDGALLKFLFRRYGLLGAPGLLKRMRKSVGKPFAGFACAPLFSAVPIANGPYAVRLRLLAAASNGAPDAAANADWGADFVRRLERDALHWELQLQPFVSEALTPIEDASVNWPSPYTTVARLRLPRQDVQSGAGQELARQIQAAVFDPWQALSAHRPLGDVQRARKVVYFGSQQGRGAV